MRFHNDLLVAISLVEFQKFDRGGEIQQRISAGRRLKKGDRFRWDVCAGISGIAEIADASIEGDIYTIKKIG